MRNARCVYKAIPGRLEARTSRKICATPAACAVSVAISISFVAIPHRRKFLPTARFNISNSSPAGRPIKNPTTRPSSSATQAIPLENDSTRLSLDHIDASGLSSSNDAAAPASEANIRRSISELGSKILWPDEDISRPSKLLLRRIGAHNLHQA